MVIWGLTIFSDFVMQWEFGGGKGRGPEPDAPVQVVGEVCSGDGGPSTVSGIFIDTFLLLAAADGQAGRSYVGHDYHVTAERFIVDLCAG